MVKNKDDDDDGHMRKNSGRREEWDQWALDYLDRVDGKGSDEASWAQRFLGTDVTIGLSAAQQRKRIQDNREAVSDLIRHQEPEDLKQGCTLHQDAAQGAPAGQGPDQHHGVVRQHSGNRYRQGSRPDGTVKAFRALGGLCARPLPARRHDRAACPYHSDGGGHFYQGARLRAVPPLPLFPAQRRSSVLSM